MRRLSPFAILAAAATFVAGLSAAQHLALGSVADTFSGPQSSQTPYVVPTSLGWQTTALLTVGDTASDSSSPSMVGIPDGLGALGGRAGWLGFYFNDRDYMTVFMNHELPAGAGSVRAHGRTGAFISEWTIKLDSLEVTRGADLIRNVYLWNGSEHVLSNGAAESEFSRFCSADLPAGTAFFNPRSWRGFFGRLYLSGEEAGNEGRAFAHVLTGPGKGDSYQLPFLGRMSYENAVAHPDSGDRTIVVNLDDSTPGQVYVYVGTKQRTGTPVQRAGLDGGALYGVKVTDGGSNYGNGAVPFESNGAIAGRFSLENLSDVATSTGALLQTTSRSRGVTEFGRPEDGAWDTKDPNVFYFVTTGASVATPPSAAQTQTARLYKLRLDSLDRPEGGTIELVVDSKSLTGTDGQVARSFDNMTVDGSGRVLVQEDPGNVSYIAKTWRINPTAPQEAEQILESDRARFTAGTPQFITQDEESSGVIEVTSLVRQARWFERGRRYYLADIQAHKSLPVPAVEDGQLYLITSRKLQ